MSGVTYLAIITHRLGVDLCTNVQLHNIIYPVDG